MQGVVPVAVEFVSGDREGLHLAVADLDPGWELPVSSVAVTARPVSVVVAPIRLRMVSWLVRGLPRQFMVIWENNWVLYLVPLAGTRWQVADADGQTCFSGERGQFGLPRAPAVAVGATTVGGDQQSVGVGIGVPAAGLPPGP